MKYLLLLSLIALVATIQADLYNCYYDDDNGMGYSFSTLGYSTNGWLNATDSKNNIWFFRICEEYSNDNRPCLDGQSVCIGNQNRGSTSTAQFSGLPDSMDGFEVIFGNADNYKTVIDFVCGLSGNITIESIDDYTTAITVSSFYACGQSYNMIGGVSVETMPGNIFPFIMFILIIGSICILICICCCCCISRKRRNNCNNKRNNIAMKEFSNIAFQPIPQHNNNSIPYANSFVNQQPQVIYYYPNNQIPINNMQSNIPIHNNIPTIIPNEDEKIARMLQAQFDQESRV